MNVVLESSRLYKTMVVSFVLGAVCSYGISCYARYTFKLEMNELVYQGSAIQAELYLRLHKELKAGNTERMVDVHEQFLKTELELLKQYNPNIEGGIGDRRAYIKQVRADAEDYLSKWTKTEVSDEANVQN